MRRHTYALAGFAPLLILIGWLARPATRAAAGVSLPVVPEDGAPAFFWIDVREQSAAVAWFGPTRLDETGLLTREWLISVHRPGAPSPLVFWQGRVAADSLEDVGVANKSFRVSLRPAEGRAWGVAAAPEDVQAQVDGMF